MKTAFLLTCLLAALALVQGGSPSQRRKHFGRARARSSNVAEFLPVHLEPVLGVALEWPADQNQLFPDTVHLGFTAFEREFSYELDVLRDFTTDAKVIVYGEGNQIINEFKPQNTVYRKVLENGWVNLNMHEDGLFHALLNLDGELFTIVPLHVLAQDLDAQTRESLSKQTKLVMYRDADMQKEHELLCGVALENTTSSFYPREAVNQGLLSLTKVSGCDALHHFRVNFAADFGYFSVFGSPAAVSQSVVDILSNLNAVYLTQFNAFLSLGTVVIRSAAGGESWNQIQPCAFDIEETLNEVAEWKAAQAGEVDGLFHLLTNCFPPSGPVGLASKGVQCGGTGLSSFSLATWKTVAHGLRHSLGAQAGASGSDVCKEIASCF